MVAPRYHPATPTSRFTSTTPTNMDPSTQSSQEPTQSSQGPTQSSQLPEHIPFSHWSEGWRHHVHGLNEIGFSKKEIARTVSIPWTTVRRIIKTGVKVPRRNRPLRTLDPEVAELLVDACLDNPTYRDMPFYQVAAELGIHEPKAVIDRTLKNAGLGRFWRMKKPKSSPLLRTNRVNWAARLLTWSDAHLHEIAALDQTAFRVGAGRTGPRDVTRRIGERGDPETQVQDDMASGYQTSHWTGVCT